jgi:hypothetical protein
MKQPLLALGASFAASMLMAVLPAFKAAAASGNHVVILVMDGARYTETWGDPTHANVPQMATNLSRYGVILTNFYTDVTSAIPGGRTETCTGHATLVCGTYQVIANDGSQFPYEPTIFQYYRQQTGAAARSGWVVTSKDKLVVLANSSKPGWTGEYQPSYNCGINGDGSGGYREDYLTHALARAALTNDHPAVLLINYKGPDLMGHANNWLGYLAAIQEVDGYAADLWATIQADPVLKDTTTLFITNDHGRHTTDFTSHGDDCEGCRHLLCLIVGPNFRPNEISELRRTQPDIGTTAADLLCISMPTATGQVMTELYQPPTMSAQFSDTNFTVSWPAWAAGYRLMAKTDLESDTWSEVPVVPLQVGSQMQVSLSPTNDLSFFRLLK